jgi:hypothetical protein
MTDKLAMSYCIVLGSCVGMVHLVVLSYLAAYTAAPSPSLTFTGKFSLAPPDLRPAWTCDL